MVEIKKLITNDVGKWVAYFDVYGQPEIGRIKSWNEHYVFVVFKCDNNWSEFENYTGCACSPECLTIIQRP